jgi:hypothetical protein
MLQGLSPRTACFVVSLQRTLRRAWDWHGIPWHDAFGATIERRSWMQACFEAWVVGVEENLLESASSSSSASDEVPTTPPED